jgi:hypothetical protein
LDSDQWQPAPQEPEIERLVLAHRAQEQAWLSYGDCATADEEVRLAQAEVDRIRNDIWRRTWGRLLAAMRL